MRRGVASVALAGVAAVLAMLPSACASQRVPSGEDVEGDLERARSMPGPRLYYLGKRFAGLPLTDVEVNEPGSALFAYGTCELPKWEGGCAPPVQVAIYPFSERDWRVAAAPTAPVAGEGCWRLPSLRGVPTVRHGALRLVTAKSVVSLWTRSTREGRRAALALRPVEADAAVRSDLPPPPASATALVDAACGSRPGERGPLGPRAPRTVPAG